MGQPKFSEEFKRDAHSHITERSYLAKVKSGFVQNAKTWKCKPFCAISVHAF